MKLKTLRSNLKKLAHRSSLNNLLYNVSVKADKSALTGKKERSYSRLVTKMVTGLLCIRYKTGKLMTNNGIIIRLTAQSKVSNGLLVH